MGEDASRLKTLSSSDFYFCQEASYNDVQEIIKKRICSCSHCAASRGSAASQLFGQTEALLDFNITAICDVTKGLFLDLCCCSLTL